MRYFIFFIFVFVSFYSVEPVRAENSVQEKIDPDKPWRKKEPSKTKKKKAPSSSKKYKLMARELIGRPRLSDRLLSFLNKDQPKIAIHPFDAEELPISLDEAQTYVSAFTRALITESKGRYNIVSRKELGAVVEDINEMGSRDEGINPIGDLITRAQSDLLAVGELALKDKAIILSYKMVETQTGRIVSASQKSFKRPVLSEASKIKGVSLNGAGQQAARFLMRDLNNAGKIQLKGLRYQTTGIHTDFGRYFTGLLSDELRKEAAKGPRNINTTEISEFVIEEENFRGLKLNGKRVEQAELRSGKQLQNYILSGTYWVFDGWVEVRLKLQSTLGRSIAWRAKIVKDEIPSEFALIPPPAPVEKIVSVPNGPIDLYLSSNKGDNPQYKTGEKMVLLVRTKADAYLSCYYVQATGEILKIFPNRFLTQSKLNAGFEQHIPSGGMPFAFEMSEPKGVEAVKCFALDQDKSPLKSAKDFVALNFKTERALTKKYRDLEDVSLSEASLIVTVH